MQAFSLIAQNTQNHAIEGKVADLSGNPVIFAHIKLDSLRKSTTTNLDGNFTINAGLPGNHQMSVQMFGFKTTVKTSEVTAKSVTSHRFYPRRGNSITRNRSDKC
ncbi:MAG: carboxypeptidase-like regulatory domain-containing protein [Bacteroidota bacterium]